MHGPSKMLTRHQFIFNKSSYQKISLLAGPNLCSSDEIENGLQNSCNESHDSPWRPEMVLKGSTHPSIQSLVVVFLNRSFHIFINFGLLPMTIPRDHPKFIYLSVCCHDVTEHSRVNVLFNCV